MEKAGLFPSIFMQIKDKKKKQTSDNRHLKYL